MKKTMKVMMLLGMVVFSNGISAQEHVKKADAKGEKVEMTPEQKAKQHTDKLKKELSLTETQEKDIYTINLAHAIEMQKLREEQRVLREKMKAQREATEAKIKAVLTPEQVVIFDQKKEEMKAKKEAHKDEHKH